MQWPLLLWPLPKQRGKLARLENSLCLLIELSITYNNTNFYFCYLQNNVLKLFLIIVLHVLLKNREQLLIWSNRIFKTKRNSHRSKFAKESDQQKMTPFFVEEVVKLPKETLPWRCKSLSIDCSHKAISYSKTI